MKLKESLVTTVLPIYNAGDNLAQCLESIAAQSYENIEIIAINDFSKDNSHKILKDFKKKYKKIQIINNKKHYGTAICLNRAMRKASGQFVIFVNPFDYILKSSFKKQVQYLTKHAKTAACGSQFLTINESGKAVAKSALPLEHDEIYPMLASASPVRFETIMINRNLIPKDTLRFGTNKYPMIFTEVFIKLMQYGKMANLDQFLYRHRLAAKRAKRKHSKIKQAFSILQLVVKSRAAHDYKISLPTSLPLLKSILQFR